MEKAETGKYKFICFTEEGCKLMNRLRSEVLQNEKECASGQDFVEDYRETKVESLPEWTSENFKQGNILVFIGALGIAVRAIAPFCKDKTKDPGVIVVDEKGTFVIPVLSGHIGGAVSSAKELAAIIGAMPVITTATDVRGEFAVDVFAKENNLGINDMKRARKFTAKILAGEEATFLVSPNTSHKEGLCLIPKCTVVGMGCRKGKSFDELNEFLKSALNSVGIDARSLKAIVSIDKKKDEQGLIELAEFYKVPFITYPAEVLMKQVGDFEHSDLVMEVTGADNVCERAVIAYGCTRLVQKKLAKDGMTIAIGMTDVGVEYERYEK
ncbi:cobalt-precorrin 5A hydrolase [Butyrivibrio sp. YAB3001]|uniref:cobalt-precorrin 5A hydrolase n=1 Tax=Butyrivibrio sp. YAB3001 TaxID=1520812 RepID=UPI0008F63A5C|nr:cobalt-precorrin 5A hydrolase [Butyrivibrio sp. YAB3001]SFC55007.1 cobalt-precorrin 5A hydrolase [Butyrivibrio sp. YAB3001]